MGRIRSSFRSSLLAPLLIAGLLLACLICAQEPELPTLRGNITAVQPPDGFDVDGYHVVISPVTQFFALKGPRKDQGELRHLIAIGTYVQVIGNKDRHTRTVAARQFKVRDDEDRTLSGFSVIDRIFSRGPLPVFRADGYTFRLSTNTEISFSDGINSVSDIDTGTWVHYEGKRNEAGEVIAASVKFVKPKLHKSKRDPASVVQVTKFPAGSLIDFDGTFRTDREKHRMEDAGGQCGWYPVPENAELQERVRRIGVSVVPRYQRDLPDDDSAKILFRFYAVEEKGIRSDLSCNDGLVLVPLNVLERLQNDDQLAAVLADGVAANLQRQRARVGIELSWLKAAETASYVLISPAGIASTKIIEHELLRKLEDERGRMALALMADAGYDPWQAPEAWRLLDSKRPARDPAKLKYPYRAGYQLEILGLQYRPATPSTTTATQAGNASAKQD